jgi:hypothetical protein
VEWGIDRDGSLTLGSHVHIVQMPSVVTAACTTVDPVEGTGGQTTTLRGLSRFLVEHASCGEGFDVSHPAGLGSGRVTMTCRGCGASHEYATATIEFEREIEFEAVTVEARPRATEPRIERAAARPARPVGPIRTKAPSRSSGSRKKALDRSQIAATLALLGTVAVAAIAIWMIRGGGTSSEPVGVTPPATTPAQVAPTPPAQAKQPETPSIPPAKQPVRTPVLAKTVITTSTFAVTIPKTWNRGTAAGGLLLTPPGTSSVAVEVFTESDPNLSIEEMGAKTASFLRSRDQGAQVSATGGLRIGGNPAFKLRAIGPTASQTALGVVAGTNRYLAIEKVGTGAPDRAATQADQVLASFRPR